MGFLRKYFPIPEPKLVEAAPQPVKVPTVILPVIVPERTAHPEIQHHREGLLQAGWAAEQVVELSERFFQMERLYSTRTYSVSVQIQGYCLQYVTVSFQTPCKPAIQRHYNHRVSQPWQAVE
jgi:hypothetical protein